MYVVLTRTYKTNHNALLANSWRRRVLEQCYTLAYFKTHLLILYGWGSPEEYHKNHSRIHTALISFLLVGIAVISLENTLCIISWLVKKGWVKNDESVHEYDHEQVCFCDTLNTTSFYNFAFCWSFSPYSLKIGKLPYLCIIHLLCVLSTSLLFFLLFRKYNHNIMFDF